MSVSEFCDLVSGVSDQMGSVKSAANAGEKVRELCRLQTWVAELRVSQWPTRLSDKDRQKALRVREQANDLIASAI